jgi:nitric oxide reductase subunit B
MGSTIGINTMVLLASIFYVIREEVPNEVHASCSRQLRIGFWTANISLAVFFSALILAGVGKGVYDGASFQEMMTGIRPFLFAFTLSGVSMMIGFWIILWHGFRLLGKIITPDQLRAAQVA